MIKAILKLEHKDTKEVISQELLLGPLFIEETQNQIRTAFVELILDKVSSLVLFEEIAYIGKHNVINSLITELNNDIEYGIELDRPHTLYLNTFSIDLLLQ